MMHRSLTALAVLLLSAAQPLAGQTATRPELAPTQELSVTQHEAVIGGARVRYTATAGYLPLFEESGEHLANVYFTAYTRDDVPAGSDRPITFAFNGGPGAASLWLHLGLGPKRVRMAEPGADTRFDVDDPLPPPYELVENEHSWLDLTDLVFIDPVGTGYSRPAPGVARSRFHGYVEDIDYLSEFIRLYTTRFERWSSPKFLAGESYGTTRVAGMSDHLQQRHGMFLNGVILISASINFQTRIPHPGNDLPHLLHLPTFTATAWYHNRLDPELQQDLGRTLAEVEEFVLSDYSEALMRGDDLPPAERDRIVRALARYTGLSPEFVDQANLRITTDRFTKELRRDDRRTVGRLDSRFVGIDRDAAGEGTEYDPSYGGAIMGPFTATLNDYLRTELGFENDLSYEVRGSVRPWSYRIFEGRYVDSAEPLRRAMNENPYLQLFVANGYYDLATPYFATEYSLDQMYLDESLEDNVRVEYYRAGHMMYIHEPSLEKLKRDISSYYATATSAAS